MKSSRFVPAWVVLVCGALCWQAVTTANASQAAGAWNNSVKTPTPPPVVVVGGTKEGAKAGASKKADGRLKTGDPKPSPKKTVGEPKSRHVPSAPSLPVVSQTRDFRLNVGICGRLGPDGTVPGPQRCQPFGPGRATPPTRVVVPQLPQPGDVRWEQILTEYKEVLFPKLGVKVQPAGRTLVNLDTIVYTDESRVSTKTVTLLGFPVVVEATPMSYSWDFGDGGPVLITSTPGKPYPAKEITHKYMKRGSTKVTLTTNYAARFNVADTGWQYVDGTVPIAGPPTALLVREAVPVLVDPPR
jgi:hypothetical protein